MKTSYTLALVSRVAVILMDYSLNQVEKTFKVTPASISAPPEEALANQWGMDGFDDAGGLNVG